MKPVFRIIFLFICFQISGQNSGKIGIENGQLFFKTFGKGTPVLIINGGPGMNSQGFESLAKRLAETNQTIIYDQRGTGQSQLQDISSKTITMTLMVDDIEALRKHLKIESWVVLGHSFGGMLASYYATLFPDRIQGLILSSSGGLDLSLLDNLDIRSHLSSIQRDSLNYWNQRISQGDTSYQARLGRGRNLAPAYLYNKEFIEQIAHRLTQSNMQINSLLWRDMRAISFDCKPNLKSFKKPTLILQGKQDILDPSIAEEAHQIFNNSELIYIDHCAHYGWLEQPNIYFGALDRFLKQFNN
ncbi:alpha/beta fold hydrolase [Mangrovimonas sp. ST2L15]|uniref:alpha/beta fold hydrolase n=1 Tax=Mangrovimonas sp. ST2L15 TaxID=1645916 RepID=UPI0006B4FCB1|nr:alpha/beta hydrolase [Mangrovimonas sp. ST2L15]